MINTREMSYTKQIWGQHYFKKSKRQYHFDTYNGPAFNIAHILISKYTIGLIVYEGHIL